MPLTLKRNFRIINETHRENNSYINDYTIGVGANTKRVVNNQQEFIILVEEPPKYRSIEFKTSTKGSLKRDTLYFKLWTPWTYTWMSYVEQNFNETQRIHSNILCIAFAPYQRKKFTPETIFVHPPLNNFPVLDQPCYQSSFIGKGSEVLANIYGHKEQAIAAEIAHFWGQPFNKDINPQGSVFSYWRHEVLSEKERTDHEINGIALACLEYLAWYEKFPVSLLRAQYQRAVECHNDKSCANNPYFSNTYTFSQINGMIEYSGCLDDEDEDDDDNDDDDDSFY